MRLPRYLHYSPEQLYKGARIRLLRMADRDQNPYATHMPVLAALARAHRVRSALELGSGPFSTSLFLNRDVFPDLERLVSYEDDPEWARVVSEASGGDPRLDFQVVPAVRHSVPEDAADFDLIFIDDSQSEEDRASTVRSVAAMQPRGLVAIHDYEAAPYRSAARAFDHRLLFKSFTPQVGVGWMNAGTVDEVKLRRAKGQVESGKAIDVADTEAWRAHLG